jgi:hypothetical protein
MNKRLYILLSCLLFSNSLRAQNWGWEDDFEAIHFTYTLQYVTSQYKIYPTADWRPSLAAMRSPVTSGFAIGLGLSKNMNENIELRLVPTLTLADRQISYGFHEMIGVTPEGKPSYFIDRQVKASLMELPLSLKLKSARRQNFGAYLTGGVKYSADISSDKRNNDADKVAFDKMLKNNKDYFSYETGIGLDFYFKFFKLSPEIKYSSSINNMLKQENSVFSKPIDKLMLRNVTFSLFIQ